MTGGRTRAASRRRLPAAAAVATALFAAGPAAAEPAEPQAPRALYRTLIEAESARTGLPPEVAEAVMAVESSYNPAARGGVGEVGLMQVLPSTARMMGFAGTEAELAQPEVNIRYGVAYLAGAWRKGGQDLCTAAMKYRAGHGETRFSHLSVNYCVAVRTKLAARGYAVTGSVPVATFGERGGAAARTAGVRGRTAAARCQIGCAAAKTGGAEIAALNERLASLVVTVRVVRRRP